MSRLLLRSLRFRFLCKPPSSPHRSQVPSASLIVGSNGSSSTRVSVGVTSTRKLSYGFRTFCSLGDLVSKKCVPCNSKDIRPMAEESAAEMMPKVSGWNLVNEEGKLKLNRSWRAKSFTKGLELFQLVGNIAETEGHHPDLHLVGWNDVKIEIWTHAVGGLTENDFILAAKINQLDMDHLLRKKKPSAP
ncbi:Pterin-4-alpha-carbinolamine dehydratase 2, mitochondrial [Linum grandiflorum]